MQYLANLKTGQLPATIGAKASNLRKLHDWGYRIPDTMVCLNTAQDQYAQDPSVLDALAQELATCLVFPELYAIRSSADIEDGSEHTYAGQFASFLNVSSLEDAMDAIRSIWDSTNSPQIKAYCDGQAAAGQRPSMAVLVQKMVRPIVSGVIFSRNPMTGAQETIVEAVAGSGEALTQAGVTPQRWVRQDGRWLERPDAPLLDESQVLDLVAQTARIARTNQGDVDLEWVYDGQHVHWVQMRPINHLTDLPIYSNRMSKEMVPGIVLPLTWSINIPMLNGCWAELLEDLTGIKLDPLSLAKSFYYHVYFEITALGKAFERLGMPRDTLDVMMGLKPRSGPLPRMRMSPRMLSLLPRIALFTAKIIALGRRIDRLFSELEQQQARYTVENLDNLSARELISLAETYYPLQRRVAYHTVIIQLMMFAYNGMLRRRLSREGIAYEQFNLTAGLHELDAYNPSAHILELHQQYSKLPHNTQREIESVSYDEFLTMQHIAPFQQSVQLFIERFGHVSDSGNDFTARPWREDPATILRLITGYAPPAAPKAQLTRQDVRIHGRAFERLYQKARQYRVYREHITYLYSYGNGLYRRIFLALADRLLDHGALRQRDDLFCLEMSELEALVNGELAVERAQMLVLERQGQAARYHDIALPPIIYGDKPPTPTPSSASRLEGIPTSRGYHTGRVAVVRGIADFRKVAPGAVLVVPYSDVGWTPLFAKAGAVIAESGGILSHSSIVAREYGIPAVVSVPDATRMPDSSLVAVDGFTGIITLIEG